MVSERFSVDWATVLVSSFSTVVIRFDGYGSGFRGTNLLHRVRRRLGWLEERDQLEALRSEVKPAAILSAVCLGSAARSGGGAGGHLQ